MVRHALGAGAPANVEVHRLIWRYICMHGKFVFRSNYLRKTPIRCVARSRRSGAAMQHRWLNRSVESRRARARSTLRKRGASQGPQVVARGPWRGLPVSRWPRWRARIDACAPCDAPSNVSCRKHLARTASLTS